jgi:nitronate monooxygenase
MLSTELTRTFGLKHPIVSAPMANWSGAELAGAVSAGGGLGMIGVGSATPEAWIAEQANLARPHGPFGIGLLIWALESRPELLDAALGAQPSAVSVHAGDPTPYIARIKEAGAKVFCQVNNGNSAVRAAEAGADFLVAQGTDAGGHTGSVGTMPLLQAPAVAVRIGVLSWDSWLLESKEQEKGKPDRMKKFRMWKRRRIAG